MKPWHTALLIVPPTGKYIREERCQTPIEELHTVALRPPMDLLYMAALLETCDVESHIIDYPARDGATWDDIRADLRRIRPSALILSITTPTLEDDLQAARIAKEIDPSVITLSKGAHFRDLDLETLDAHPELDLVMRGEYEKTVVVLARGTAWAEIPGITYREPSETPVRTPDAPFIQDLDSIPFPARHRIDNGRYYRPDSGATQATIVTERGCPYPCIFCLAGEVGGKKVRVRSPENVVGEIRECVETHGIRDFLFRSDLFTANRKWVREVCRAILAANLRIDWSCNSRVDTLDEETLRLMKESGCWLVSFGVESGNEMMLEKMKKKADIPATRNAIELCRKVRVKSSVYFLIGLPWEDEATFEDSVRLACELDPDFVEFFYAYPFHGTEFYDLAVEYGLLQPGQLPLEGYNHAAIPTLHLSAERLAVLRREALKRFYLRPRYIMRTLLRARSPRVLFNYFRYGFRQLVDLFSQ